MVIISWLYFVVRVVLSPKCGPKSQRFKLCCQDSFPDVCNHEDRVMCGCTRSITSTLTGVVTVSAADIKVCAPCCDKSNSDYGKCGMDDREDCGCMVEASYCDFVIHCNTNRLMSKVAVYRVW